MTSHLIFLTQGILPNISCSIKKKKGQAVVNKTQCC